MYFTFFFKLYRYAFILLTSTLVPGINYFVVTTHPLHQLQVRKRSSSSCPLLKQTKHILSLLSEGMRGRRKDNMHLLGRSIPFIVWDGNGNEE